MQPPHDHTTLLIGGKIDKTITNITCAHWFTTHRASTHWLVGQIAAHRLCYIQKKLLPLNVDVLIVPHAMAHTPPKVLVLDFDATLVTSEGLDLLADAIGIGNKVATITACAMRGEIDFHQSLLERVRLLANVPTTLVQKIATKQPVRKEMATLVQTAKRYGTSVVIISGGFDLCIQPIAKKLGIDTVFCHRFAVANGKLTGDIIGNIIDAQTKSHLLEQWCKTHNVALSHCLALGDGANDIPMLQRAGMGVALHPKPVVQSIITNSITKTNAQILQGLFYAMYCT